MALTIRSNNPWTDMLGWLDTVTPLRGTWDESYLPVEEYTEDGHYVIRADLPGIDPDRDVTVSIEDNVLSIHAERRQEEHDQQRSEVRYGEFTRRIALPRGCKETDVTASYAAGVLMVSLPIAEPATEPVRIPIARTAE